MSSPDFKAFMKPLCVIAFMICGSTWGWYLGGMAPAKESYFLNQQAAHDLNVFVGLIAGFILGTIWGALAAKFLDKKYFFVPVYVLLLSFLPLAWTELRKQADAMAAARIEVDDRKRDQQVQEDAKRTLDAFTKATGWTETRKDRISRSYDLTTNADETKAKLVSLGATNIEPLPHSSTLVMRFPSANSKLYIQLTPTDNGGSHVMIQY